jgi:hypothetical protein
MIPPAPRNKRTICPTVQTSVKTRTDLLEDGKPVAMCRLVTPTGLSAKRGGKLSVSTGATEREALLAFLEEHQDNLYDHEVSAIADVCEYLREPNMPRNTPQEKREAWLYDDLITRGRRRRRHRKVWWDPISRAYINIYADTLKAHVDPACKCRFCVR